MENAASKMITINQPAKSYAEAGITDRRIRRMIWDGKLPYIKSGKRYLVNESKFIAYPNEGDERR